MYSMYVYGTWGGQQRASSTLELDLQTGNCKPPYGWLESDPQDEQQVLLITESPLQALISSFLNELKHVSASVYHIDYF